MKVSHYSLSTDYLISKDVGIQDPSSPSCTVMRGSDICTCISSDLYKYMHVPDIDFPLFDSSVAGTRGPECLSTILSRNLSTSGPTSTTFRQRVTSAWWILHCIQSIGTDGDMQV